MDWFSCGIGWFSNGVEWGYGCFSLGFPVGSSRLGFFWGGFSGLLASEFFPRIGSLLSWASFRWWPRFFWGGFSGLLASEFFPRISPLLSWASFRWWPPRCQFPPMRLVGLLFRSFLP